jgi:hypothetical protein
MMMAMIQRMDQDGDGTINPDEIDDRFRGMADRVFQRLGIDPSRPVSIDDVQKKVEEQNDGASRGRRANQPQEEKPKDGYLVEGSSRFAGRKTYSVGEGPELPKGLPSWWSQRDQNKDGNVTMAEFLEGASSARRIEEFVDYDFNDDGVITPKEGKAEKK